jgi:acetyl esterase/lipase
MMMPSTVHARVVTLQRFPLPSVWPGRFRLASDTNGRKHLHKYADRACGPSIVRDSGGEHCGDGGRPALRVEPQDGPSAGTILYVHGGGWV